MATLTLQPGAEGIDTYLRENASDINNGASNSINIIGFSGARNSGLIKFDLSSLVGKTITSAILYIYATGGGSPGLSANIYRILVANSGWIEGTKIGSGTADGATWNYANPTSVRWAGDVASNGGSDAGCSVSGTDHSSTLMANFTPPTVTLGDETEIPLDLDEFELMVANNSGMIFKAAAGYATSLSFASSDHVTAAYRPKLVVEYVGGGGGGSKGKKPPIIKPPKSGGNSGKGNPNFRHKIWILDD